MEGWEERREWDLGLVFLKNVINLKKKKEKDARDLWRYSLDSSHAKYVLHEGANLGVSAGQGGKVQSHSGPSAVLFMVSCTEVSAPLK